MVKVSRNKEESGCDDYNRDTTLWKSSQAPEASAEGGM